jgi:hypothetical protein
MPWCRTSEGSLAIYGDEGEWIATCASAAIAGEIVETHNFNSGVVSPGRAGRILPATPLRAKGAFPRFDADVDAIIDIADEHLARQALKNDSEWLDVTEGLPKFNEVVNNGGWTNHL